MSKKLSYQLLFITFISGLFADFSEPLDVFSGTDPKEVRLGDMDGDGSSDIVFVDSGTIKIIYQKSAGANQYSALLDGDDEYFSIPQTGALAQDAFTVGAWFNIKSYGASRTYLWKSDAFDIYLHTGDKYLVCRPYYDDGSTDPFTKYSFLPELNTWYHVVFTHDASTGEGRVYINGKQEVSRTVTAGRFIKTTGSEITVGGLATDTDKGITGNMDEIVYFNTVFSDVDVAKLYNFQQYLDVSTLDTAPNLVSWWTMGDADEDDFNSYFGSSVLKDSYGSNDGTAVNTEPDDKVMFSSSTE
ncbi:MAG: LamG domain-containing protein [Planctomycetes bacterium]|nr:LamG domain-containing protein [Planctomycetota bacterium]